MTPTVADRKREAVALMKAIYSARLTPRQRDVLRYMRDTRLDDGEVVVEGNRAMYGLNTTNVALVYSLLRLMAIKLSTPDSDEFHRYTLTGVGEDLLEGRAPRENEWC